MDIAEAKRRAQVGPKALLAGRAFTLIISLTSTFTIARLVSPRDYGLANMSMIMLALAVTLRDFGMTNALMRKGSISQAEMSFVFWFNSTTTVLLTTAIAIASPWIAEFYRQPIIVWTILVSLVGFLFSGIASQYKAMLSRNLEFARLATIEAAALFTGFLTTLVLAYLYRNVWAIVFGNAAQMICASIMYVSSNRWKPDRPAKPDNLRELLSFGANTSIYSLAQFAANNAAPIIIGRVLGAAPLGQFNRAQALFQIPSLNIVQPIAQATLPFLARMRPHPEEYRVAYLGLVRRLSTFLMPGSAALCIVAVPLVRTLLGDRWHDAGMALTLLAPSLAAVAFAYAAGDLFVSQNRSDELRTLGIVDMIVRIIVILIGVQFGILGAVAAFSAASILMAFARVFASGRKGPVGTRDQLRAGIPGMVLGIVAAIGAGAALLLSRQLQLSDALTSILGLAFGGGLALAVGLVVRTTRMALIDLFDAIGLAKVVTLTGLRRFAVK